MSRVIDTRTMRSRIKQADREALKGNDAITSQLHASAASWNSAGRQSRHIKHISPAELENE